MTPQAIAFAERIAATLQKDFVAASFCELCARMAPRSGDELMGDMREDVEHHDRECPYRLALEASRLEVAP